MRRSGKIFRVYKEMGPPYRVSSTDVESCTAPFDTFLDFSFGEVAVFKTDVFRSKRFHIIPVALVDNQGYSHFPTSSEMTRQGKKSTHDLFLCPVKRYAFDTTQLLPCIFRNVLESSSGKPIWEESYCIPFFFFFSNMCTF